jgi:uncharacterized membrane protein
MTEPAGTRPPIAYPVFSIIAGLVGWFASFELLTERIKTLAEPEYVPNCNISVLVTCGPNMSSWQGSVFGFTNTIFGVVMFVAPILIGVSMLAGARFAGWWWMLYQLGNLFGISLVFWLFSQSVYALGTLCPWCMVVWTAMIPLWWVNILRPYALGDIPLPQRGRVVFEQLYSWVWVIIVLNFVVLAVLAQLQLDWVSELLRFIGS